MNLIQKCESLKNVIMVNVLKRHLSNFRKFSNNFNRKQDF